VSGAICLRDFVDLEVDCRRAGAFDDADRVRGAVDAIERGQLAIGDVLGWNGRQGFARAKLHEGSTNEVRS